MTIPLHRNTVAARDRMAAGDPQCRCQEAPSAELLYGIKQFNGREFFECHETLEAMWLAESDEMRYLYQGILQVGVGYLHLLRGNHHGAITKLHSGCALLEYFTPSCMGVDVQSLLATTHRHVEQLQLLGAQRLADFDVEEIPCIRIAVTGGSAA